MHLIRASLRYASRKYWVPLSRDLRPIYAAPDEAAAAAPLETFAAAWEQRYPVGLDYSVSPRQPAGVEIIAG